MYLNSKAKICNRVKFHTLQSKKRLWAIRMTSLKESTLREPLQSSWTPHNQGWTKSTGQQRQLIYLTLDFHTLSSLYTLALSPVIIFKPSLYYLKSNKFTMGSIRSHTGLSKMCTSSFLTKLWLLYLEYCYAFSFSQVQPTCDLGCVGYHVYSQTHKLSIKVRWLRLTGCVRHYINNNRNKSDYCLDRPGVTRSHSSIWPYNISFFFFKFCFPIYNNTPYHDFIHIPNYIWS